MRLVKEVLPNGRVRFARTFYAILVGLTVLLVGSSVAVVVLLVSEAMGW